MLALEQLPGLLGVSKVSRYSKEAACDMDIVGRLL
jgi:hypothetical protein